MKKYNNMFKKVSMFMFVIAFVFGFAGLKAAHAATLPPLGTAATFSVLGQTQVTNVPTSSITGDVGLNNTGAGNFGGLTTGQVAGTIYDTNGTGPDAAILPLTVQPDAVFANADMLSQGSPTIVGPALDGLVLAPGVYDIGAGRLNGGVLTLSGAGVYIFRASSDFVSSGSINFINGARACNLFWSINTLATINGSTFAGTIIAGTGIHFGANVTFDGRALAIGGDVSMISDTISGPSCSATIPQGSVSTGAINVVKVVINDNGGTKTVSDFPLFVSGTPVTSGVTNIFPATSHYVVTETNNSNYTQKFSGDCDISGGLNLNPGAGLFCIITNDDIGAPVVPPVPPLIDVVKTALPLSLPNGPGPVVYTYTLRNIGTVPVTDITLVGDTCSPIVRVSGDTNNDNKLDLNETWVHTCSTTLQATHTNTVVATGWANGISAVDIASATVVVGIPIVPPIIHVTKIPSPLTLSAKGGIVTYTNRVTNPGTVALSNVRLSDDKCATVKYVSGDANADSKLDVSETWIYSCQQNLIKTTTNTITATGDANGLTARDFAIATVVVAAPSLPKTGLSDNSDFGQQVRTIANSLGKGSKGNSVIILQQFLISQDKGPKAKELSTNGTSLNFGPLTKAALAEWQKAVGITPATGNFGSITRAYLKAN